MLVGNKERFAIEAEPQAFDLPWIWGRFRFWLGGQTVGNWDDAAALQACFSWLRDFSRAPPQCTEPTVFELESEEVFRLLVTPVLGPGGIADPGRQPIPYAYERFHITHLGMSSFDPYVLVLVKNAVGAERCLWRKHDEEELHECRLLAGEMEKVAADFCEAFESQFMQTES